MPRKQVGQIDADLLDRVDAARGDVPRTKFVERALESALRAGNPSWVESGSWVKAEDALPDLPNRADWPVKSIARGEDDPSENRAAASPQVSAHVRPAIPKKG